MINTTAGNVQQKISCVFETKVVAEQSSKRTYQPYKVTASDIVKETAVKSDVMLALTTEKIDGTCALIQEFSDKIWLWARLDKKANKIADKRYKKYQDSVRKWELSGKVEPEPSKFKWNVETDFKNVPVGWIPASGVAVTDGIPQPDANGHIPGWIPVDPTSRQHLWHLACVDLDKSVGLVLQSNDNELEITLQLLNNFCGCTMEVIGTNINGNPYRLGTKEHPIHLLVRHGSISFSNKPEVTYNDLQKWFTDNPDGAVEGIVWHCKDGSMFKIHRHHFGLPWPVDNLRLNTMEVTINVDITAFELTDCENLSIVKLGELKGSKFNSLQSVTYKDE